MAQRDLSRESKDVLKPATVPQTRGPRAGAATLKPPSGSILTLKGVEPKAFRAHTVSASAQAARVPWGDTSALRPARASGDVGTWMSQCLTGTGQGHRLPSPCLLSRRRRLRGRPSLPTRAQALNSALKHKLWVQFTSRCLRPPGPGQPQAPCAQAGQGLARARPLPAPPPPPTLPLPSSQRWPRRPGADAGLTRRTCPRCQGALTATGRTVDGSGAQVRRK